MSDWVELYGVLSRARDSERAARAVRAAYEAWCVAAEVQVMTRLQQAASDRAGDIQQRTGGVVLVEYPAQAAWMRPQADVRIRALGLSFRGFRVDMYWYRAQGAPPFVHLAHGALPSERSRFPVLISLPGCRVERAEDGGHVLRDVSAPGAEERVVERDALLLRAFTILVNAAVR